MTAATPSLKSRLPAEIATARLSLTTPVMAHVAEMAVLANNKRIHEVLARLPHPYAVSDGVFFVDHIARGETEFAWSILHEERYIGTIGLHLLPEQLPELGYWLGEPYWGQGFATEAARALVDAARAAGATALRSRALKDNAGSRNVLRKAGFSEIGEAVEASNNLAGRTMVLMHLDLPR
jgi:RimJ/RimL family protein N-acetyltransferase